MLWYKSWLETRWRFAIGLLLLMGSAWVTVMQFPKVGQLLLLAPNPAPSGELGRRIVERIALMREYRGYVWSQWFRQDMPQLWIIFAALIGSGGLLSRASDGAALFTLSLPVSRRRIVGTRAATGLAELLLLAIVPSLLIPILSPAVGQSYGAAPALLHALCLFVGGAVFFSLSFALSTVFNDLWRPLLVSLAVAVVLALCEQAIPELWRYSIFGVMSAEDYFRGGHLPWIGLLLTGGASAALLTTAAANVARRDF